MSSFTVAPVDRSAEIYAGIQAELHGIVPPAVAYEGLIPKDERDADKIGQSF
jgi:hypothetical protein